MRPVSSIYNEHHCMAACKQEIYSREILNNYNIQDQKTVYVRPPSVNPRVIWNHGTRGGFRGGVTQESDIRADSVDDNWQRSVHFSYYVSGEVKQI